jgi:hypothetical protein
MQRAITGLRGSLLTTWIAAVAAMLPVAAYGQQEAQDREEFDRVARRAFFSTVPVAENNPFRVQSKVEGTANAPVKSPGGVRVILASPYGR